MGAAVKWRQLPNVLHFRRCGLSVSCLRLVIAMSDSKKIKILILGGGFGGLYTALRLDRTLAKRDDCEVVMVDKTNFTLFTPMLHEVAASDLDPSDIVTPIRKMLRHVTFFEGAVEQIDLHGKTVLISGGLAKRTRKLQFDHLVLSLGSETRFFNDETRENAVQLKSLGDAVFMRNRLIGLLEAATIEPEVERRQRMLSLVVAGGGFAGVEAIGAINDFLRGAIKYYPQLDVAMLKLVLVHPSAVLLPEFPPELGRYTEAKLRDAGIDIRMNTTVDNFDGQTARLKPKDKSEESIEAQTLLWTAGIIPTKIVESLPMKKEKGRLVVEGTMESAEFPGVWAVGDCAMIPDPRTGKPYPQTAQHAIRQGARLARNIEASIAQKPKKPFLYRTIGQLAAIGRRRGAAQIFGFRFSGFIAWFLWRGTYLWKLPGIEKKIRVAIGWMLDLFFSRDLVQLITVEDVQRIAMFGVKFELVQPKNQPPAGKMQTVNEPAPEILEAAK